VQSFSFKASFVYFSAACLSFGHPVFSVDMSTTLFIYTTKIQFKEKKTFSTLQQTHLKKENEVILLLPVS